MHPPSPSHKDTKQVGLGQGFSSNTTETEKIKALQACTFDATSSNDFRPWRQNVWQRQLFQLILLSPFLIICSAAHGYFNLKVFDNRVAKYTHAPV